MQVFWVGLETKGNPHGHGEDYREYVLVPDDEDPSEKIHAAVMRWAKAVTRWDDGSCIAVRIVDDGDN